MKDTRLAFELKMLKNKGAKATFDKYLTTIESDYGVCGKSLPFLKLFVNFDPNLCERIIRNHNEGDQTITLCWGSEYISKLNSIAAMLLDNGEIKEGLFWAKKSIDALSYFNPDLKGETWESAVMDSTGMIMIHELHNQFHEELYENVFLDWEIEQSKNKRFVNDN